jgi:hypothetical protein
MCAAAVCCVAVHTPQGIINVQLLCSLLNVLLQTVCDAVVACWCCAAVNSSSTAAVLNAE